MKKIRISEASYDKLKKKLVNEISYGTVDRAFDKSEALFGRLKSAFDDFYMELEDSLYKDEENPYLQKINGLSEIINDILTNKVRQQDEFFNATTGKVDHHKFYDSEDANDNDIEDMDLKYLQSKYGK